MSTSELEDLTRRLDELEAYRDIQQLAARYALAVDSKDIDAVAGLFVSDVKAGPEWGVGRDALREFFRDSLSNFYRSMHLIAGHVIELDAPDRAHGVVHCRAEHEIGPNWGIMVMNYRDDYEREDGRWLFRRRRPQTLYTTEVMERPHGPNFNQGWPGMPPRLLDAPTRIPSEYPTFADFWIEVGEERVRALTLDPVDTRAARKEK